MAGRKMPTVIALDVSLSMCRLATTSSNSSDKQGDAPSKHKLAVAAINQFLDHISAHCKLEFLSLVNFA